MNKIATMIALAALICPQARAQHAYTGPALSLGKHQFTKSEMPVTDKAALQALAVDCWGETMATAAAKGQVTLFRTTDNPVRQQGKFTVKGVAAPVALSFSGKFASNSSPLPLLLLSQAGGKCAVVSVASSLKSGTVVSNITLKGHSGDIRWIADPKNGVLLAIDAQQVMAFRMPNLTPKAKSKKSVPAITLTADKAVYTQQLPASMHNATALTVKNNLLLAVCPDQRLRTWDLVRQRTNNTIPLDLIQGADATQIAVCLGELLLVTGSGVQLLHFL